MMMEAAIAILIVITLGAYLFYLAKIANKDKYSQYSQITIELEKTKAKMNEVKTETSVVKPELKKAKTINPKLQYKCVVIITGSKPCQTAQGLALKPILMSNAPILPLAECDAVRCTCKFTKHDDRRSDDRRAHLKAAREIMGDAHNRREKKERRKAQYN